MNPFATPPDRRAARELWPVVNAAVKSLDFPPQGLTTAEFDAAIFAPPGRDPVPQEARLPLTEMLVTARLVRRATVYGQPRILPPTPRRRGRPPGVESSEGRAAHKRLVDGCKTILHHLHRMLALEEAVSEGRDVAANEFEARLTHARLGAALRWTTERHVSTADLSAFLAANYDSAAVDAVERLFPALEAPCVARPTREPGDPRKRALDALRAAGHTGLPKTVLRIATKLPDAPFRQLLKQMTLAGELYEAGQAKPPHGGRPATIYRIGDVRE